MEWSPPRTLPKDQRPTTWDAPQKARLDLPDMKPPASEKRFTAVAPPAVWEEQPAQPARFRDQVWRITGQADTECYLTAQVGGGVAGNLARWYGQFGIKEVGAVESLPVVELAGKPGRLLELSGTYQGKSGQGMMLAFTAEGDTVTTLKFTGPEAVVKAQRDSFLALAKCLRAGTPSPMQGAPTIQPGQPMPPDHPPVEGAPAAGPSPGAAPPAGLPLAATAPAGWTVKAGSQRLLHHTFGTDGEVYVSQLGGGLRATMDIWRGELGLPAATDAEFAALGKVGMLGAEGALLDVAGNYRSMSGKQIEQARLLVAAHQEGNTITFVKLVGKAADVEGQREAFLAFCSSLRRNP